MATEFEKQVLRGLLLCSFFIFLSENYLFRGHVDPRASQPEHSLEAHMYASVRHACTRPGDHQSSAWAIGMPARLERHVADQEAHGDVCRILNPDGASGERWFCPWTCTQSDKPPFCLSTSGTACRIPAADEGPLKPLTAGQHAEEVAAAAPPAQPISPVLRSPTSEQTVPVDTGAAARAAKAACTDPSGDATWATGAVVALETHNGNAAHGDVCRVRDGGHFCPKTCVAANGPPWCVQNTDGQASRTPCRVSENAGSVLAASSSAASTTTVTTSSSTSGSSSDASTTATSTTATSTASTVSSSGSTPITSQADGRVACANPTGNDEWAKGAAVDLETHAADPSHGDVCRVRTGGHFCPKGCESANGAPWCVHRTEGHTAGTSCRWQEALGTVSSSPGSTNGPAAAVAGAVGGAASSRATDSTVGSTAAVDSSNVATAAGTSNSEAPPTGAAGAATTTTSAEGVATPAVADVEWASLPTSPKPLLGFSAEVTRLAEALLTEARRSKFANSSNPRLAPLVLCGDYAPKLLTQPPSSSSTTAAAAGSNPAPAAEPEPLHDPLSFSGYTHYYTSLLASRTRSGAENGDVFLHPVPLETTTTKRDSEALVADTDGSKRPVSTGAAQERVFLRLEGRGDVMASSMWAAPRTEEQGLGVGLGEELEGQSLVPEDPVGRRSGGALVWTAPDPKWLDSSSSAAGGSGSSSGSKNTSSVCEYTVWLTGPLLVIANWFPGNFHHFLHDTMPLVFFVRRFRATPSARFGLVDHPLHRRLLNWLDPKLVARIDWLPLGKTICCVAASTSSSSSSSSSSGSSSSSSSSSGTPEEEKEALLKVKEAHASAAAEDLAAGEASFGPLASVAANAESTSTGASASAGPATPAGVSSVKDQPAVVAVQFRSGAPPKKPSKSGKAPSTVESASIFNFRNAALSRLMALEIFRLKPPFPTNIPTNTASKASSEVASTASGAAGVGAGSSSGRSNATPKKTIVFYRRHSNTTLHGRSMPLDHEEQLFQVIRRVLRAFNRPEKLVIFNGEDPLKPGTPLTFQRQWRIFSQATLVLGPHGAGLANLAWLPPPTDTCAKGPAVLEFICTKETSSVQTGCPGKTHWSLLGGTPWIKYYHLFLAKNSTAAAGNLFVEAQELETALTAIFTALNHDPVEFPANVDASKVLGSAVDPLPMLVPAASTPSANEVPYFFHVPKAAGTSIERILSTKRKMKTLPSGDLEDLRYVERSQALKRNIIAYVKTPLFSAACGFLGRVHVSARVFTVVREPIGRIVSLFWYKKDSTWEKSYDPKYRNQSMELFLKDAENDWLTYTLASAVVPRGEPEGSGPFLAADVDVYRAARWVLLERMVVGFMDDMENSLALIFDCFGWPWVAGDVAKLSRNVNDRAKAPAAVTKGGSAASNASTTNPSTVGKGGAAGAPDAANSKAPPKKPAKVDPMAIYLPRIASLNQWDTALYKEARVIYDGKIKALLNKRKPSA